MDKRAFAKMLVTTLVGYAAHGVIEKTLESTVPVTKKFKTAEITGAVGGWYVGEKLKPTTDQLVDDWFDKHMPIKP